jgi:hypothetical protein
LEFVHLTLLRGYREPKRAYIPVTNPGFGLSNFPPYKENQAMRRILFLLFPAMIMFGTTAAMAQKGNPAIRAACRGDAQRLCAGIQPGGGRIGECLKAKIQEVSPQCLDAVKASRAAKGPR